MIHPNNAVSDNPHSNTTRLDNNGSLYIVATPIGNLKDITYRAIEVLSSVDLIAAEDTRHTNKLLQHYGIVQRCIAVHEHNERQVCDDLLEKLSRGVNLALVSDAGTPLVSDPGFYLVRSAKQQGFNVVPIPGVSAVVTALSVAGLPTNRFSFEGFLPAKSAARQRCLSDLVAESRTMVFYESPHRVLSTVRDMLTIFGPSRYVVLARELTKLYETVHGDLLGNLLPWLATQPHQQKGEMVLLVHGADSVIQSQPDKIDEWIQLLLSELPVKKVVAILAQITGEKKNHLYKRALELVSSEEKKVPN